MWGGGGGGSFFRVELYVSLFLSKKKKRIGYKKKQGSLFACIRTYLCVGKNRGWCMIDSMIARVSVK